MQQVCDWLKKSRPHIEKVKASLLNKLPISKELLEKVEAVLAIDMVSTSITKQDIVLISSLKSDIRNYIKSRKKDSSLDSPSFLKSSAITLSTEEFENLIVKNKAFILQLAAKCQYPNYFVNNWTASIKGYKFLYAYIYIYFTTA
jgi:hypothetical protein